MSRPPTSRQVVVLEAIQDERGEDVAQADRRRLHARGWATDHTGLWQLTRDGEAALADAQDLAEYEMAREAYRVRIRPRPKGMSPIKGGGRLPAGREVVCHEGCEVRWGADRRVVWYTNEAGRDAQKAAEAALRLHVLAHARGEVAIPPAASGGPGVSS